MNTIHGPLLVTAPEDLHRLAALGRARGLTLYRTGDGALFCTSASNLGLLHRVGAGGCDCPGFARWQRCSHHSIALAELGMIPGAVPPACVACHSRGWQYVDAGGDAWPYQRDCAACGATGRTPAATPVEAMAAD